MGSVWSLCQWGGKWLCSPAFLGCGQGDYCSLFLQYKAVICLFVYNAEIKETGKEPTRECRHSLEGSSTDGSGKASVLPHSPTGAQEEVKMPQHDLPGTSFWPLHPAAASPLVVAPCPHPLPRKHIPTSTPASWGLWVLSARLWSIFTQ
jgi:hypothetical protein